MRRLYLCGFLTASALFANAAFAQMGGMGSSMGGMGGMGSSMGGFGSSMGGMGSSMGGMGGNAMGGMGGQQGGAFIGGNRNQQQFLGRNSQVTGNGQGQNGMNQFGQGNRGGGNRGNLNTFNNMMGGMNGNMGGGMNTNQAPAIRPRQRVAFDYPVPTNDSIQTKMAVHISKMSTRNPGLKDVNIAMNPGGEAVLTGSVSSQSHSKLAENLLRLEPGVRSVRNELTFPEPAE